MNDTQWDRYQVFLQAREDEPHLDVGRVHAPDPEMALQNARDVFVRRPDCQSLWVVPVDQILHRTNQEIDNLSLPGNAPTASGQMYHLFCKTTSAGMAEHIGTVRSETPQGALAVALAKFVFTTPPFTWMVVPDAAVTRSQVEDIGPMFFAARDKPFRLSSYYHVMSEMRAARKRKDSQ
jgi:ring-1,2-phenylacetyl-CoA epoxidase subunit PaaB